MKTLDKYQVNEIQNSLEASFPSGMVAWHPRKRTWTVTLWSAVLTFPHIDPFQPFYGTDAVIEQPVMCRLDVELTGATLRFIGFGDTPYQAHKDALHNANRMWRVALGGAQ